ncbi:MAG: tetratricopeptide repeat protein, partial [Gemmatimonadales bacterium]
LAGAGVLVLALGAGAWALLAHRGGSGAKPRIVVLPPRNLGPPEQAYVADGIAEEINNRLVGVAGLEVIGRTSAERYRDTDRTPRQIGAELDADYILALRVGSEGPANARRLRVSAELVRGATEAQLWGKSFTAQAADDYFQVQSEIAAEVASEMGVTLGAGERKRLAARPTASAEAYDYYLQGAAAGTRGPSVADFRDATERYGRAVEIDPRFALAWVGLGLAHIELYWFWGDRSARRRELSQEALERAAALAPDLPEVHFARGVYFYHGFLDYARALEEMRLAVAQDPGRAAFHEWIGYVLRRSGRLDEAIASLERAMALDPQSGRLLGQVAETYATVRRYRDAERLVQRAASLAPTDWGVHHTRIWVALCSGDVASAASRTREAVERLGVSGILADRPELVTIWLPLLSPADRSAFDPFPPLTAAMSDTGSYYLQRATARRHLGRDTRADFDSAIVLLERKVRERPDDALPHERLGRAYAGAGRRDDAVRAGQAAVARAAKDAYAGPFAYTTLAEIYARFGELDRAAEQLERFIAAMPFGRDWVRYRPEFAALRHHPRIRRLIGG